MFSLILRLLRRNGYIEPVQGDGDKAVMADEINQFIRTALSEQGDGATIGIVG